MKYYITFDNEAVHSYNPRNHFIQLISRWDNKPREYYSLKYCRYIIQMRKKLGIGFGEYKIRMKI